MNILNRFLSASLWSAGFSYIFFGINFLSQIILARLLFPKDFGVFALAFAIREIMIGVLGFSNVSGYINTRGGQRQFNACVRLAVIASIVQLVVALFITAALIYFFSTIVGLVFFVLSISQIFLLIGKPYLAPLEKQLNYKVVALLQGISSLLGMIIAILIAYFYHSVWGLVFRDLAMNIFLFCLAIYFCEKKYQPGLRTSLSYQLYYGIKVSAARVAEVFFYRIPDLLINVFLGKSSLGNFYQSRYLSHLPIKVMKPFTQEVVFAFFSYFKKDKEPLSKYINYLVIVVSRILFPVVILVYLFGKEVFVIVYGAKWLVAGECFRYFSFFIFASPIFAVLASVCYVLNKQRYVIEAYFIAIFVFLTGLFFWKGVVVASFAFSLALFIAMLYLSFRLRVEKIHIRFFNVFFGLFFIAILSYLTDMFFGKLHALLAFFILYAILLFIERRSLIKIFERVWFHHKSKVR